MTQQPDLAGIYITDDFIDVVVGRDERAGLVWAPTSPISIVLDAGKRLRFNPRDKADASTLETIVSALDWVSENAPTLRSVCMACYGPFWSIDPADRGTGRYGRVQKTSHGRMSGLNLYEIVTDALRGKTQPLVDIQTDVNAAALGELVLRWMGDDGRWIEGHKEEVLAFVKISRGIGGGIVYGGDPFWLGRKHPEMGQIRVARWTSGIEELDAREAAFPGTCPYHGDCLEGLASADAIAAIWRTSFLTLQDATDHLAWQREAYYIAQLCVSISCLIAPSQIVLGGRVMGTTGLLDKVRSEFRALMGRYEDGDNASPFPYYRDMLRSDFIDGDSMRGDGFAGRPGLVGTLAIAAKAARRAI